MQKWRLWRYTKVLVLAVFIAAGGAGSVFAVSSSSSSDNYEVTETQFNAGSSLETCSDQYCAQASIGDIADSEPTRSTTTAAFPPIQSSSEPMLEVIVDPGESNLGILSTETTASKTTTVKIRNYLSGGYILQIIGDPPTYSGHALDTPDSPTAASPGTEQFGINAVANTTPSIGASPIQVPSSETSFGTVEADYGTANLFMYTSGDVVARSLTESGRTDYTISMIVNISNSTPAGRFTGDYSAVVIPIY